MLYEVITHGDERGGRRLLVVGHDGGARVADEADLLAAQRLLVLADGKDPELDRQVAAGEHEVHARMSFGARHVDRLDHRA